MQANTAEHTLLENSHVAVTEESTSILAGVVSSIANRYSFKKILDIGTGNGYIAITLAKQGHKIDASDISAHSIALATRNAMLNGVTIRFFESDLMKNIHEKYDLVCFNPPCGKSGPLGTWVRNRLKKVPGFEHLTLTIGFLLFRKERLELINRLLNQCTSGIVLKLINLEKPSWKRMLHNNGFSVIEDIPITQMTSVLFARSHQPPVTS